MMKKNKTIKKKKVSFFLKDFEDKYSMWSEEDLSNLDFIKLLDLVLENKLTLCEYLIKDAKIGLHLVNDIPVVEELNKSLDKIYKIYPTVKYFIDDREKLLNSTFKKA